MYFSILTSITFPQRSNYKNNALFETDFVPNTSDDEGRYKIGNQANVGLFNLNKLLQALKPLLDPRQKQL